MNIDEILTLYDREERRETEFPDMVKEVFPGVIRFVRAAPEMSFVLYTDLDETTADAAIDDQLAFFLGNRQPFEWKVFAHDRPADMVERLVARGLQAEGPDAIMVLDLNAVPETLLRPPAADVRRLTDPAQLADIVTVLEPVWGESFDWVHERLGKHMMTPGLLSVYVAYVDAAPACAGWVYYSPSQFASLWGGSTLEAYRGRGLYTALMAARVQEARERGRRYVTVDAGPMSKPILARHGFEVMTYATACEYKPDGAGETAASATRDQA